MRWSVAAAAARADPDAACCSVAVVVDAGASRLLLLVAVHDDGVAGGRNACPFSRANNSRKQTGANIVKYHLYCPAAISSDLPGSFL